MFAALLVLLAAPASTTDIDPPSIEHTPVTRAPRGVRTVIEAIITDPSGVFAPQVFVRAPKGRFQGVPMEDRENNKYVAEVPAKMLSQGSFDYFIEAYDELGNGPARSGTPDKPYTVQGFEAPPKPVRVSIRAEPGKAQISIDGAAAAQSPVRADLPPGSHLVAVSAQGFRPAEHHLELTAGRDVELVVSLAQGSGPGSLQITSEPSGARVLLDGERIGVTPFKGELAPGAHRLAVEQEGFLRQERDVVLEPGRDVEQSFTLPPLPRDAALSVETVPAGALLVLDGVDKGRTPWVGTLPPGPHAALVRMEGRREVGTDFVMPQGKDLALRLELPVATAAAISVVTVASEPSGATVVLDGAEVGVTPWSGPVKPGEHKLQARLSGFLPQDRSLPVQKNRDVEASFALQREPGPAKARIETDPAGASVLVDNKDIGKSPVNADLQPGEHQIEAVLDGYRGMAQQLAVEAGAQLSLRLALQKADKEHGPPLIVVNTQPAGAQVTLDGAKVGESPVKTHAQPGPHELKMSLDGYAARTMKFTLPEKREIELVLAVALKETRSAEAQKAPDARELARAQLKRAAACYRQGDYACALTSYQAAYEFKPVPDLLFNIAQARRRLKQYPTAAEAYRAFVKEGGESPLVPEATRLAALCDDLAKGGAAKPADEDTEPPVLTHTAIARAQRSNPLKVTARITDNRSGVFGAQVCFRNLYAPNYECTSLLPTGKDEFAAEIPARAVTDGLAYFVEAYDNAGNGPARSGAPERPNAIALEDAVSQARATMQKSALAAGKTRAPGEAISASGPSSHSRLPLYVVGGAAAAAGATGLVLGLMSRNVLRGGTTTVVNGVERRSLSPYDLDRGNNLATGANVCFGTAAAFGLSALAILLLGD